MIKRRTCVRCHKRRLSRQKFKEWICLQCLDVDRIYSEAKSRANAAEYIYNDSLSTID